MKELIVDSFAGGGGASTGIEMALGRSPDFAINHDDVALSMHRANHPKTSHLPHNIWKVDPSALCAGRPVGLLWASPDCKHFSKAKGGKPVEKSIRDLAWVIVRWAKQVKPRVILMENVEEFVTWGPLGPDSRPCPKRKGEEFQRWIRELKRLGYKVEWREMRACDHGAPTIRKRFFLIARRDGKPIVWPKPTHGDPKSEDVKAGKLLPWRVAAEVIDWSLPCPSIFLTKEEARVIGAKRPLAEATMARIAKGVKRYVLDAAEPFLVSLTHHGGDRNEAVSEPFKTITGAHRGEKALIAPFVTKFNTGAVGSGMNDPLSTITANSFIKRPGGAPTQGFVVPHLMTMRNAQKPHNEANKPTHTVTAGGAGLSLVSAFMAKHYGGHETPGADLREPVSTVTTQDHHAVVSAGILNMKGSDRRQTDIEAPSPTQCAGGWHIAEVRAFLMKYYGNDGDLHIEEPLHTVTTRDRFGLVTVHGEPYQIVDIGMRMLTPRELFRAQGFPENYIIDRGKRVDGVIRDGAIIDPGFVPISKTDQVRMCGNSVCPQMAEALVRANYREDDMPVDAAAGQELPLFGGAVA